MFDVHYSPETARGTTRGQASDATGQGESVDGAVAAEIVRRRHGIAWELLRRRVFGARPHLVGCARRWGTARRRLAVARRLHWRLLAVVGTSEEREREGGRRRGRDCVAFGITVRLYRVIYLF